MLENMLYFPPAGSVGKHYYFKYTYTHDKRTGYGKICVWANTRKEALLKVVDDVDDNADNITVKQIDEAEYNSGWKSIADYI